MENSNNRASTKRDKYISAVLSVMIIALIILILIFSTIATPNKVSGTSMEPTILDGQRIYVNRLQKKIERDKIIVVTYGQGKDNRLVKRVIALPGDELVYKYGKIYVNGNLKNDKFYFPDNLKMTYNIPKGYIFVVGDNRANSYDSRNFGPISISSVIGTVINKK